MPIVPAHVPHPSSHFTHAATILASLAVGAAFFALWFWLLPPWLGFRTDTTPPTWHWFFAAPSIVGFAIALRCIWDFGRTGHGTPAPIAPPQNLVVVGFYRYVRNPMYVGFFIGWISLWIVFGQANPIVIISAAAVVLGVHLFVLFYEEPTLRKKFGPAYSAYTQNVHRWLPRLHPWSAP